MRLSCAATAGHTIYLVRKYAQGVEQMRKVNGMKKKKVLKVLKNELRHAEQHLRFKDMSQEYYDEMQNYVDAMKIAIKAVKKKQKRSKK